MEKVKIILCESASLNTVGIPCNNVGGVTVENNKK